MVSESIRKCRGRGGGLSELNINCTRQIYATQSASGYVDSVITLAGGDI